MYKRRTNIILYILCIITMTLIASNNVQAVDISTDISVNKEFEIDQYFIDTLNLNILLSDGDIDLDEFYLEGNIYNGLLSVGRKYVKSGPGYFSQLMLSDQGTPLNLIMHEGKFSIYNIENNYRMLVAYLDEDSNKQLFHHRISNDTLIKGLEVGISESMIASENINPVYYLPVPYLPYYLTAYLSGLYNDYNYHDDKYVGIDFTYCLKNNTEIYGELLVDEYPRLPSSTNPDKRAHLIGVSYPYNDKLNIRAEYSNVFNYVYLHRFRNNRYTYDENYIGHWLGNDGDVIDLEFEWKLSKGSSLKTGVRYIRRGIGDMETDFGADHEEKKFLYEITEREKLIRLSYNYQIKDNIELRVSGEVGESYTDDNKKKNVANINLGVEVRL